MNEAPPNIEGLLTHGAVSSPVQLHTLATAWQGGRGARLRGLPPSTR